MLVKHAVISGAGGESLVCWSLDNELASLSFCLLVPVLLDGFSDGLGCFGGIFLF